MAKPVICFDVDGTLVDESGSIHLNDVKILARNDQAIFIPSTGRLRPSVRSLFSRHGLFVDQPLPFPLALQNGAAIYLPGEKLLRYRPFPEELQAALLELMLSAPQVSYVMFSENEVRILWPTDFASSLLRRFELDAQLYQPQDAELPFSKFMAFGPDPERLEAFARQTDMPGIEQAYSMDTVLELTPDGIHKGQGVQELIDEMGLQESRLLVAGDGGNDLALFELTGNTFAPQDSPPEVQAKARTLIDVRREGLLVPMLRAAQG